MRSRSGCQPICATSAAFPFSIRRAISLVLITGAFFGYMSGGYLADRIGRRLTFLVFAIGAGIVVVTYTGFSFGNSTMLFLGFPLGFFASGVFSGMGAFYTEHFPTRVRGVGQGFAYNLGRGTGALFPTLVGLSF